MGDPVIEAAFPACRRLSLGLGRDGSISGNGSGDIFIVFSAANQQAENGKGPVTKMLPNDNLDAIFAATVQAVEESVIKAIDRPGNQDRHREPQSDGITTRSITHCPQKNTTT